MVTPGGYRTVRPVTRLGRLDVGGTQPAKVLATILPGDRLPVHGGVDGVIGQDFLASRVYTIDYRRKAIVWHTRPVRPLGSKLSVETLAGRLFVVLPNAGPGCGTLRMIPDTGSDGLVLFARAGRALPPMTPLDVVLLRTVSGQRLVRRVLLDVFVAGDLQFRDQMATLVPRTDADSIFDWVI